MLDRCVCDALLSILLRYSLASLVVLLREDGDFALPQVEILWWTNLTTKD